MDVLADAARQIVAELLQENPQLGNDAGRVFGAAQPGLIVDYLHAVQPATEAVPGLPAAVAPTVAPETVAESAQKIRELVVLPSVEKVLSQLPSELKERIGLAEVESMVRLLVVRETVKVATTSIAAHDEAENSNGSGE
jgi:hypothetical protein